jgi:hypothetical protein
MKTYLWWYLFTYFFIIVYSLLGCFYLWCYFYWYFLLVKRSRGIFGALNCWLWGENNDSGKIYGRTYDENYPVIHGNILWYITYDKYLVMSCDTSPTIDAWSCNMIRNLPSMHGHVIWYMTYHRCMVMSCDT